MNFHTSTFRFLYKLLALVLVVILAAFLQLTSRTMAQGDEMQMCAVSEQDLLGQQWEVNGTAGGTITSATFAQNNGGIIPFGSMATTLTSQLSGNNENSVLVLVLDNFDPGTQPISHGEYVLELATESLGSTNTVTFDSLDYSADPSDFGIAALLGSKIEFNGGSDVVVNTLEEPITYSYVVINMSFIFIECHFEIEIDGTLYPVDFNDFKQTAANPPNGNFYSFENYLIDVAGLDISNGYHRVLVRQAFYDYLISTANAPNAVKDFLDGIVTGSEGHIIPIAAAGNFGGPAPFAPGSWPSVISVGGSTADIPDMPKWGPAQSGEVMAPAAWYETGNGKYLAGTSFAAPVVSAFAALLASTSSSCDFTPLMNKVDGAGDPLFDNEYFVDALTNACQP